MRSARAVTANGRARPGTSRRPRTSRAAGAPRARRSASPARNQRRARARRAVQMALTAGHGASLASASCDGGGEERRGVGGEAGLGRGDEGVERGVDDGAAGQRVGLAAGRVEAAEAEDLAGVDAVGVADQAFHFGDGELGRAGLGRWARRRPAGGRHRGGGGVEAGGVGGEAGAAGLGGGERRRAFGAEAGEQVLEA